MATRTMKKFLALLLSLMMIAAVFVVPSVAATDDLEVTVTTKEAILIMIIGISGFGQMAKTEVNRISHQAIALVQYPSSTWM